jgi:hypothetical protein
MGTVAYGSLWGMGADLVVL